MNKGLPEMMQKRPRRKGHFWASIFAILVVALAGWLAINGLFNPYSFLLGGRFHPWPGWQGAGWLHSDKDGGDYWLYVNMTPSSRTSHIIPATSLRGVGFLCTPFGDRIRLKVSASMAYRLPSSTVGEPINIYASGFKAFRDVTAPGDYRPTLHLHGVWGDQVLVVEDEGTLEKAFMPDGTLAPLKDPRPAGQKITATLKEAPWWQLMPECPVK